MRQWPIIQVWFATSPVSWSLPALPETGAQTDDVHEDTTIVVSDLLNCSSLQTASTCPEFSSVSSKPCDSFSVDKSNVPQTSAEIQTGSVWVQRMMSVAWGTNLNSYQSKSIPNTVKKIWTVALPLGEKKKNRFVSMSIYFLNYFAEPTLFATIAAPGASPKIPCCSL